jgi:hypothetical protein
MTTSRDQLDSKKQVYSKMLSTALIYLRAHAARPWYRRMFDRWTYYEVELLHNLPVCMFEENFVAHDIWFLNHQAKYYCELKDHRLRPLYAIQAPLISRLFALVPEEMRGQLEWNGPSID